MTPRIPEPEHPNPMRTNSQCREPSDELVRSDLGWTIELLRGFVRIALKRKGTRDRNPHEYFEDLSRRRYSQRHKDSADTVFARYLQGSALVSRLSNKRNQRIYDLGTGYGNLFTVVEFHPSSEIILVDFVDRNLQAAKARIERRYARVSTMNLDIRTDTPPKDNADAAFCMNVLPYLESPDLLLAFSSDVLRLGGNLLLLYPLRSLVWEETFEGVGITFHDPQQVAECGSRKGLIRTESTAVKFAVWGTARLVKVPIASLDVFVRER